MMMEKMKNLVVEEEGQGMVEYGLIIGLISVVAIVALGTMGTEIGRYFDFIVDKMAGVTTTG